MPIPAVLSAFTPKAWRFVGEMGEIANSLAAVGLPAKFHDAAGDVYTRMADLNETMSRGEPEVEDDVIYRAVIDRLLS